jgi:SAM-dependent methyltransferase
MPTRASSNAEKFDRYAGDYERLHAENVALSGEGIEYFAQHKVECLRRHGVPPDASVLDFGCGIGSVTAKLAERFERLTGYEPSSKSAALARRRVPRIAVHEDIAAVADEHFDVAVLSCVLHHVPPRERRALLRQLLGKLRKGGRVFVFEHNPLNPLTRHAVRTCAFDDDAVLLWPWETTPLLESAGFGRVAHEYIVFFPKPLAFLRPLESRLSWLPAGAQQLIVGTKC